MVVMMKEKFPFQFGNFYLLAIWLAYYSWIPMVVEQTKF